MKLSDIPSNLPAAMSAELLSCDPGQHKSAVAYWLRGRLVHVGFVDMSQAFVFPGQELAIEIPQVYPHVREEDPNDLIQVAYAAGKITGLRFASRGKTFGGKSEVFYRPRKWKGQVPKHIHHHRIMQTLGLDEIAALPPETAQRIHTAINGGAYSWQGHNLLDAVGIGLVYLGRMHRGAKI